MDSGEPAEQPFYVNAKQYHRILKRRVARAKLEESLNVARGRRPYLHESRHKHAMRRPRGQGGRFLTAAEIADRERKEAEEKKQKEEAGELTGGPDDDKAGAPAPEIQRPPPHQRRPQPQHHKPIYSNDSRPNNIPNPNNENNDVNDRNEHTKQLYNPPADKQNNDPSNGSNNTSTPNNNTNPENVTLTTTASNGVISTAPSSSGPTGTSLASHGSTPATSGNTPFADSLVTLPSGAIQINGTTIKQDPDAAISSHLSGTTAAAATTATSQQLISS